MKRVLSVAAASLLLLSFVAPAYAQSYGYAPPPAPGGAKPATTIACQFVLGFKTLHDLDPSDVGDCTENQSFAPNGDAQQHTGKGLLAWRKADNWTAFTDGYWTWINGPSGLSKRLNSQRFSWEANPENLPLADAGNEPAASPAPVASATPAPAPASGAPSAPAAPPSVAPAPVASQSAAPAAATSDPCYYVPCSGGGY